MIFNKMLFNPLALIILTAGSIFAATHDHGEFPEQDILELSTTGALKHDTSAVLLQEDEKPVSAAASLANMDYEAAKKAQTDSSLAILSDDMMCYIISEYISNPQDFLGLSQSCRWLYGLMQNPTVIKHLILTEKQQRLSPLFPNPMSLRTLISTHYLNPNWQPLLKKDNLFFLSHHLQHLSLNDALPLETKEGLAKALKTNTTLKHLKLGGNGTGDSFGLDILNAIANNPGKALTSLDLSTTQIGDEAVHALTQILQKDQVLTTLSLGANLLTRPALIAIAQALEKNKILKSLDLQCNLIGDEVGQAFGNALKTNTTLTSLNLSFAGLGAESGKSLAAALEINTSLEELNLMANRIGDEAGKALANALKVNKTVKVLILSSNSLIYNGLADEAVKAFVESLSGNTTLTKLFLGYCRCMDPALKSQLTELAAQKEGFVFFIE